VRQIKPVLFGCVLCALISCARAGFPEASQGEEQREVGPFHARPLSDADAVLHSHTMFASADRQGFALVWTDMPPRALQLRLNFALLNAQGGVTLRREGVFFFEAGYHPSRWWLRPSGDGYLLFYHSEDWLHALRFNGEGWLQEQLEDIAGNMVQPSLFSTPQGFGCAFRRLEDSYYQIKLQQLAPDGIAQGGLVQIGATDSHQHSPQVVTTSQGLLASWYQGSPAHLLAVPLDETGGELAPANRPWTDESEMRSHRLISVDTGHVLATWTDLEDRLRAGLLDQNGQALWAEPIELIEPNRVESLSWTMRRYDGRLALAWESDVDSVVNELRFRWLEPTASAPNFGEVETLTDPGYEYCCPGMTTNDRALAISFIGWHDGGKRLYLTTQVR